MKNFQSVVFFSLIVLLLSACDKAVQTEIPETKIRSVADKLGTNFTHVESAHFKPPQFSNIALPEGDNGAVSWGATGVDSNGNVYVGVSTYSVYHNTAFLYQYDPVSQNVVKQSDVITQLKNANLYNANVSQNKLHSKFYQADDGYIYFTSFDEGGESASRGILPTHGSHLWRKKPNDKNWEHLLATKEALIALNTDGRYVYALGYWNHILYQYDTLSRRFNRVTVGAYNGHTTRNFLVNSSGRVFVPKVERKSDQSVLVNLMEYDSNLNLMDTHPLDAYSSIDNRGDHGIVSYANMKNGDIYFSTGSGALYRVYKTGNNKHKVELITYVDEANEPGGYFSSMFSIDGDDFLVGLGSGRDSQHYSWFIHQISTQTTVTYEIEEFDNSFLLYGSVTRDNLGNLYVVGVDRSNRSKHIPQFLQLSYPKTAK